MNPIELDGSLDNNLVRGTVLLWGFVLGAASVVAVRFWQWALRHTGQFRTPLVASLVVTALYVSTPWTERQIATMLDRLDSPQHFDKSGHRQLGPVRFRDGPPALPAWGIGAVLGFVSMLQKERPKPWSDSDSRDTRSSDRRR
jgi:hypothetical protein